MIEAIGLIISLLALIYLFFKQNVASTYQRSTSNSANEGLDEADSVREWTRVKPKKVLDKHNTQEMNSSVLRKKHQKTTLEKKHVKHSLENQSVKLKLHPQVDLSRHAPTLLPSYHRIEEDDKAGPSKAQLAIQRLTSRRDLLIYQEIIDQPKSLRPYL